MDALFWMVVGALIGWHVPAPFWATAIINKVKELLTTPIGK